MSAIVRISELIGPMKEKKDLMEENIYAARNHLTLTNGPLPQRNFYKIGPAHIITRHVTAPPTHVPAMAWPRLWHNPS